MPSPQAAICTESASFGLFLTLVIEPGGEAAARRAAAALSELTQRLAGELAEPALVSALGIGAAVWPRLVGGTAPSGLAPFRAIADGPRRAPSTPADLFVHIHSPRHDANFALARAMMGMLGPRARVIEEIHGFRNRGGRDLTGFVDGTENPKGDEKAAVALVGDEDPVFVGGSYVSIQRWVHDLAEWEALPIPEQEGVIGRTKDDDHELDEETKPPSAHIARVVIEEHGNELQIVRHSLPYGTIGECGLYFVAYAADPLTFDKMLGRMINRDAEGNSDRLMEFSRPVTGAAFFAPSVEFLRALD